MVYWVFALGAFLAAVGLISGAASINLVPTEIGLLYAQCAAILVSSGAIVSAIAALIARLDRLDTSSRGEADIMARASQILREHEMEPASRDLSHLG